ncbi:S24 family peptidase [Labrys portucalensis]|uniref:S24 family peptidase n=1 Tax=Labrys neptuniae TaxID=376174 RepID=A0ABV6ZJV8_9HYPH
MSDDSTLAGRIQIRLNDLHLDATPTSLEAGLSASAIRNILEGKSKSPRNDTLVRLARVLKTSVDWLGENRGPKELDSSAAETALPPRQILPPPNASISIVPAPRMLDDHINVLGLAKGGADGRFQFNGDVVETIPRPDFLRGVVGAYGLYVEGDSMFPRYKAGELVWIHPGKSPKREDDVVVQLHPDVEGDPPEGYIKEFRGWSPSKLLLWQWNPAEEFNIDRPLVKAVHVIVGRR